MADHLDVLFSRGFLVVFGKWWGLFLAFFLSTRLGALPRVCFPGLSGGSLNLLEGITGDSGREVSLHVFPPRPYLRHP